MFERRASKGVGRTRVAAMASEGPHGVTSECDWLSLQGLLQVLCFVAGNVDDGAAEFTKPHLVATACRIAYF
jgi:hypothetical protein